ncbi:MAG: protein translocase subunit SecF [Parcubacteria group bacterium]|nr:MAG: protein translocase subunit SecF [Parcubacteria group bacterium]
MYNIIGKRKFWLWFSGILMTGSILLLAVFGLKPGIDFTGGSLLDVSYSVQRPSADQISDALADQKLQDLKIQPSGEKDFLIRFQNTDEPTHQAVLAKLKDIKIETAPDNTFIENRFDAIGPVIGEELRNKAIQGIALVLIFIVLYIAWAFRKVSRPVASWKYGVAAIIALIHDITIVTGIFALFGVLFGTEVDSLFVTALLTILGFSVHDTIVTFDRTRENLHKRQDLEFEDVLNLSINETMVRSLNTSIVTLLALSAVYLFGGESTKNFTTALLFGIVFGTYSSIFVASPILLLWNRQKRTS